MKKTALLLALMLVLVSLLTACSDDAPSDIPEGYAEATNDAVDFYFYYPEDWTLDRNDGLIKVIVSDPQASDDISNVTATVLSVNSNISSIEEYFDMFSDEFQKSFADYREIGDRIEGDNSLTVCYTGSVAGVEYKYLQFMLYGGGNLYTFTYTAPTAYYDAHLEDAKALFNSVNFKS